jgi:hypothetical protein
LKQILIEHAGDAQGLDVLGALETRRLDAEYKQLCVCIDALKVSSHSVHHDILFIAPRQTLHFARKSQGCYKTLL